MAFAGIGDALLYPVLPVYADTLGLSTLWVGILLSVNRFVSIPLGGMLVGLGLGFNKISNTLLKHSEAIKYVSGGALILIGFGLLVGGL